MSNMSKAVKIWALVPAAGIGTRMQSEIPKQYLKIRDKCILEYTLQRFCSHPAIDAVVVAIAEKDPWWPTMPVSKHEKLFSVIGGAERCHSVFNGLCLLTEMGNADDWVMVHDAARPCLRVEDMDKLMSSVMESDVGGLLAVPVRDTMKRAGAVQRIKETIDRENLWHALTPQMFRLAELNKALEQALTAEKLVTDEAQAMEMRGAEVLLVEGYPDNIKVTHPRDLLLAELFLQQQGELQ